MKIIIILATGVLLNFPENKRIEHDCFIQGKTIIETIAEYRETGIDQGWYLKDSNVMVAGHYCD